MELKALTKPLTKALTLHPRARRDLDGSHTATITRIEALSKSRARITFELNDVTETATVRRNYPLSLHPRSALYALLTGLKVRTDGAVDLATLVGVKAQIRVARRIVATKNVVLSVTATATATATATR